MKSITRFKWPHQLAGIIALLLLSVSVGFSVQYMVLAEAAPNLTPSINEVINADGGVVYYGGTVQYKYTLINGGSAHGSGMDVFSELETGSSNPFNFTYKNCGGAVINESTPETIELANVYTSTDANCEITFEAQLADPYPKSLVTNEYYISPAAEGGPEVGPLVATVLIIPAPECGNGYHEVGNNEECDDGGNVSGDGCSSTCKLEVCGDNILQVTLGEECDDGNEASGDGCSSICRIEYCGDAVLQAGLNEECDDGNTVNNDGCSSTCKIEVCGDGILQLNEQCDDGNTVSGDGCASACTLEICGNGITEAGEECDDGNRTNGDSCLNDCTVAFCGDGWRQLGVEQCDDGNTVSGDGCSPFCSLETCGDGETQSSEECDDGNNTSGDGCSAACFIEECGDGIKQAVEQCDDGNTVSGDGCSTTCQLESCGDSLLQSDLGEECDDGNNENGDGCNAACQLEVCGDGVKQSPEQCDDGNEESGDGCSTTCQLESCGDGELQSELWEECDDGNNTSGDGCNAACQVESCGDGVKQPSEQCDDGNNVSGDGCNATCQFELCGDGNLQSSLGEECDDGNNTPGDGCSSFCKLESCGDGITQPGEQCDDGNNVSDDGCSATCQLEITSPECGNSVIELGEQCDDGNNVSGDGCSAACLLEGEPFCGDGVLQEGEECEDGNQISGDGCSSTCQLEGGITPSAECGNGVREGIEQCDDGNTTSGDGCSSTCQLEGGGACVPKLIVDVRNFEAYGPDVPSTANVYLGNQLLGSGLGTYEVPLADQEGNFYSDTVNYFLIPKGSYVIERVGNGQVKEGLYGNFDSGPTQCGECDGKVKRLRFRYHGQTAGLVRVEGRRGEFIFQDTVQPNEEFEISGEGLHLDHQNTLGTTINILVQNQQHVGIHTSCSEEIWAGQRYGDFEIVSGESRNNGMLWRCRCGQDESGNSCSGYERQCGCGGDYGENGYVYMNVFVSTENAEITSTVNSSLWPFENPADGHIVGIDIPKYVITNDEIVFSAASDTVNEYMSVWDSSDFAIKTLIQSCNAQCPSAPIVNQVGEVPCWAVEAANWVIENELFSILDDEDLRDAVKFYRTYQLIMGQ